MKVTFICGCESGEIVDRENLKTMSTVTCDDEGFLVCMVHHERRKGWRSLPVVPGTHLADWRYASKDRLLIEDEILFPEEAAVA